MAAYHCPIVASISCAAALSCVVNSTTHINLDVTIRSDECETGLYFSRGFILMIWGETARRKNRGDLSRPDIRYQAQAVIKKVIRISVLIALVVQQFLKPDCSVDNTLFLS